MAGLEDVPEGELLVLCFSSSSSKRSAKPASVEYHKLTRKTFTTGQIESNYDEITDSFDAMNLKAELLRGMNS